MGKTLFMFPGQGAQYIGMGKDFYDNIPESRKMYELASEASGLDVKALCFEENDQINITEYTQIAMLATEAAILAAVHAKGIRPDGAAGLSLGEYGALIAAGVMEPKDAFYVVRKRGIFMQEAYPAGGAMSAVLALEAETVERVCESVDGIVTVANYNCPGQIVISGEMEAVEKASELLKEQGAKRVLPLKVSGPFHSALLADAGKRLGEVLSMVTLYPPEIPYLANFTADYVKDNKGGRIADLLVKQVSGSVRWQQTIERAIADGYTEFIEIGPGHTLSGFMKKIAKEIQRKTGKAVDEEISVINIEKREDLDTLC